MQVQYDIQAGTEDFSSFIASKSYYVDKTMFLRPLLTRTGVVALFTRPRRFGKTLTMTMLRDFLKVDRENPGSTQLQERLFKGLAVMEDRELCARFMGQHPVIFITLKDAGGDTFEAAADSLASTVSDVASEHRYLLESRKLCDPEKKRLEAFIGMQDGLGSAPQVMLEKSVLNLARMLHAHFGRKVVVLVDEYDVPLARAQRGGYHSKMTELYSKFMGFLKKTSGTDPICKVIMTGCLRVAKNQIFTGANNFTPYTVVSDNPLFPALFGFTREETEDYLSAFDLSEYMGLVKENYDGYRILGEELFCPWDVSNFISDARLLIDHGLKDMVKAKNYWSGSESTNTTAIKDYVGTLSRDDNQRLQDLVDGREVEVEINDNMNYDCLDERNARDMWSLLLHTGYLTATKVISQKKCLVRIPNNEIRECFRDSIMASFKDAVRSGGDSLDLGAAILGMDRLKAEKIIKKTLGSYVEARFSATSSRPENFYEGYMLGILSCSGSVSSLKLEAQAGRGFADIVFSNSDGDNMAVVELKVAKSSKSVRDTAKKAIEQILDREYARQYVENDTISNVLAASIAFFDRGACVEFKALKGYGAKNGNPSFRQETS